MKSAITIVRSLTVLAIVTTSQLALARTHQHAPNANGPKIGCQGDTVLGQICYYGNGQFTALANGISSGPSLKFDNPFYGVLDVATLGVFGSPVQYNPGTGGDACAEAQNKATRWAMQSCRLKTRGANCQVTQVSQPTRTNSGSVEMCQIEVEVDVLR